MQGRMSHTCCRRIVRMSHICYSTAWDLVRAKLHALAQRGLAEQHLRDFHPILNLPAWGPTSAGDQGRNCQTTRPASSNTERGTPYKASSRKLRPLPRTLGESIFVSRSVRPKQDGGRQFIFCGKTSLSPRKRRSRLVDVSSKRMAVHHCCTFRNPATNLPDRPIRSSVWNDPPQSPRRFSANPCCGEPTYHVVVDPTSGWNVYSTHSSCLPSCESRPLRLL